MATDMKGNLSMDLLMVLLLQLLHLRFLRHFFSNLKQEEGLWFLSGIHDSQVMTVVERTGADTFEYSEHGNFVFVPMLKGNSKRKIINIWKY